MKKKYIIALCFNTLLFSCSKLDLNPLSQASNETWYNNASQVEMSLNTLFLHQFWPIGKSDIPNATAAIDELADDWTNRSTLLSFTSGTMNSQTPMVVNYWSYTYKAIARCNTLLANIEKARPTLSTNQYNAYVATAKFVRASQYARIITLFGDPVFFTEEMDIEQALQK